MSKKQKNQEELAAFRSSSRISRSLTRGDPPRDAGRRREASPENLLGEATRVYSSPTLQTEMQGATALPEGSRTEKNALGKGQEDNSQLDRVMEMLTIMRLETKESLLQVQREKGATEELVRKQGEAIKELHRMIVGVPPDTPAWDYTGTRLSHISEQSEIQDTPLSFRRGMSKLRPLNLQHEQAAILTQPPRTNSATLTTTTTTTTTSSHSRMSCMEGLPSRQRSSDEYGQRFRNHEVPVDRFPPRHELRDEELSHPAFRGAEDRNWSPFEPPSYWGRPTATFPPRGNNTKLYKLASMLQLRYPRDDLTAQQFVRLVEIVCRQEQVSEAEIVHTLNFLLKDRALRWYELVQNQINTWEDFKERFLKQFGGQTTDLELSVKLARRRQATGESNDDFILENLDLVKKMKCPPSEGELVLETI